MNKKEDFAKIIGKLEALKDLIEMTDKMIQKFPAIIDDTINYLNEIKKEIKNIKEEIEEKK